MWIVCSADNSHKMSISIFCDKQNKNSLESHLLRENFAGSAKPFFLGKYFKIVYCFFLPSQLTSVSGQSLVIKWIFPHNHANIHNKNTPIYNFDPVKPHFYTVKLGFTGVYIIFLISAQKHRLWYSLELPHWGSSNEYPQSMFWAEIWKISEFLSIFE